jgi:phospholipase D1/2
MSLWYEHAGLIDRDFANPESLQCVRKLQRRSKDLWAWYCGERVVDLPGHLLSYPVNVLPRGDVTSLDGYELFPDTNAPVLGKLSGKLPSVLTV